MLLGVLLAVLATALSRQASAAWVLTGNTSLSKDYAGNITFGASNITLDCNGHKIKFASSATNNCGSNKCAISVMGRTNITIRDCEVVADSYYHGLWVKDSDQVSIMDSSVSGASDAGVRVENTENLVIGRTESSYNDGEGFAFRNVVAGYVNDVVSSHNEVDGFDDGASGTCSTGSRGVKFIGTVAEYNGENGFEEDCSNTEAIIFGGTSARRNGKHGYSLDNIKSAQFSEARAENNKEDGIRFQNVDNSYVAYSTFKNNSVCDKRENSSSTGNQWIDNTIGTTCN